jgi:hypothetical protein
MIIFQELSAHFRRGTQILSGSLAHRQRIHQGIGYSTRNYQCLVFKSQPPTAVFPLIADLSPLNLDCEARIIEVKCEVEGLATVQFPVLSGPEEATLTV